MILGTITQKGFDVEHDIGSIPLQHSTDPTIKFVKDELYETYAVIPTIGYYDGITEKCITAPFEDGTFKLPKEVFENDSEIVIAFALSNGTETIVVGNVNLSVRKAPGGVNILPSEHEWQSVVTSFMNQFIELQINPKIKMLTDEAASQQIESARLQANVNTAVESCGKYTFENQVLKFQQADGTYGDSIHLEGQSTVFLDDGAKNVELNTIHVAELEKVNVQVVVDGKQINVSTDVSNITVKNKKDVEITLKDYLSGLPQITVSADSTSAKIVWDDDIC